MKIDSSKTSEQNDNLICSYSIQSDGDSECLWFSIDNDFSGLVSDRTDAALAALLIPAMERGEDISVSGTISERLYYTLQQRHQALLQTLIPSLSPVDIHPETVKPAESRANGVATGFSAGIDSFDTLADHYFNNPPSGFEVSHLLFNNVGSHGSRGEKLFNERYELLRPVADRIGLPFIAINSNMHTFYDNSDFQQTHTQRNTAVALLLQNGIGRFLYGSTFDYRNIHINDTYDMAYSDPISLPLLSTGGLDALSVGCEYTRVEKTLRVANIEESYQSLNICASGSAENCSTCWKCRRTLLVLDIAGLLDQYSEVFDLKAYYRGRELYMAKVLSSDDPLLQEIVWFAKSQNFEFPPSAKALSKVYNPASSAVKAGIGKFRAIREKF